MEIEVTRQFTDEVKRELLGHWGLSLEDASFLGGFENFVFEVRYGEGSAIFRVSHGSHRSADAIQAELALMEHVRGFGVRTPGSLAGIGGALVASTGHAEHDFHAVLFEKAPGRSPTAADFGPELCRAWGNATGAMHRSVASMPAMPARPAWYEDDLVVNASKYMPESYTEQRKQLRELMERMHTWPTTPDVFGLIHSDLHHNNFFLHEGQVIAFDFDDSNHHWLVNDIAIPLLYSATRFKGELTNDEYAEAFLTPFLEGYRTQYDLPASEFDRIPELIRFREILLVIVLHKKFGPDRFEQIDHDLLAKVNHRIENDIPVFNLPKGLW